MKIDANIKTGAAGSVKKNKAPSGGASFSSHIGSLEEEGATSSASALNSLNSVNSLFALQEVSEDFDGNAKSQKKAFEMLDYLEDIRLGLLTGDISVDLLNRLGDLTKNWREKYTDPKLQSIIEEIELRSAVELAKLER